MSDLNSPKWKFFLAKASDLSNIGELKKAKGKSQSLIHNRAGSASFTLSLDEPLSADIWPYTSAIRTFRKGSRGILTPVWSGPVTGIEENFTGGTMTVTATGWLSGLEKRVLRRVKDYSGINPVTGEPWLDAEIIMDLIKEANTTYVDGDRDPSTGEAYVIPVIAGADPATPTLLRTGQIFGYDTPESRASHYRRLRYEKYTQILTIIDGLTSMENGCDIRVDPETREVNVWEKKMDTRRVVFSFGWGPRNLREFSRTIDTSSMVNYMVAGSDPALAPAFADTRSFPNPTTNPPKLGQNAMKAYGIQEEIVSISGAKNTAVLGIFAAGEVLLRSSPRMVYSVTPHSFSKVSGPGRIPEPLEEYDVGDKVYLTARHKHRLKIDRQAMRVFGMTFNPDDNGNEVMGPLQLSPT